MNRVVFSAAFVAGLSFLSGCGRSGEYAGNGESVYMSGRSLNGKPVEAIVDREGLRDPDMVLACASCHGMDRKGARNAIPDFGPYTAPGITAAELRVATATRPAYDRRTLSRAVTDGLRPDGKRLHHPMPRWKLHGKDLDDVLDYLLHD